MSSQPYFRHHIVACVPGCDGPFDCDPHGNGCPTHANGYRDRCAGCRADQLATTQEDQ